MHIFIDEAGTFSIPKGRRWSVSCVGALVILERDINAVLTGFNALKKGWGGHRKELKGSKLDEGEIASLVSFLAKFDVLFEVTAIDMAMQTPKGVTTHRLGQAYGITANLTDQYHPKLVEQLEIIQGQLEKLANQLYVQAVCSFEVLYNVMQKATLYFSQRAPEELAEFYWTIDAKDINVTPFEELWRKIVLPILQSQSFRKPFIQLKEADYSHFEKYCQEADSPPDYLREAVGDISPFRCIIINEVYQKHLQFDQSHENLGLQIVDILTNGLRRAMNGNLQITGWGQIGRLMVQSDKESQAIHMVDLSGRKKKYGSLKPPYWEVIPLVERTVKPMLAA